MALDRLATSDRFPYLTVGVAVREVTAQVETLLDTGFDGFLALPEGTVSGGLEPDNYLQWTLADGSRVTARAYFGVVQIGSTQIPQAVIIELGDEPILGRRVIERFRVVLDHGQQVIFER